ncbi:MAG: helix-turn-helix transcriptional regulator [Planctomycetia bacterium]|nr:helix-turn-helix transcriptional regulator [Planctomycetia bacterium]
MAEFVVRGAGAVLRRHRQLAKLTLEALAERAGLEKSQLSKYEANKVGLSDEKLATLAKALGIPPETLAYDCLLEIKPNLKSRPIGRLLGTLAGKPQKSQTAAKKRKPVPAS